MERQTCRTERTRGCEHKLPESFALLASEDEEALQADEAELFTGQFLALWIGPRKRDVSQGLKGGGRRWWTLDSRLQRHRLEGRYRISIPKSRIKEEPEKDLSVLG